MTYKITARVIPFLPLLFISLALVGCSTPDPLADKIMHEGDQIKSLFSRDTMRQAKLNNVTRVIDKLKHDGTSTSELKPLLDQRAAIMREKARFESNVNAANKRRDQLIAQWEAEHHGQKYEDPQQLLTMFCY